MRDRIVQFITSEGISPARFADEIGVQRSSISHLISGRNNPSFDFIQKMLIRYKHLNAEWLLLGTGNMFKSMKQGVLFDIPPLVKPEVQTELLFNQPLEDSKNTDDNIDIQENVTENTIKKMESVSDVSINSSITKNAVKVLIFYADKTFAEYIPEK
jgi:transcriptional regulator with XRE-family HTH domain